MEDYPQQKLLKPDELAEFLRVDQHHLRQLRARGMPYLKLSERVYRYPVSAIVNWANALGAWPRKDDLSEEQVERTFEPVEQEARAM